MLTEIASDDSVPADKSASRLARLHQSASSSEDYQHREQSVRHHPSVAVQSEEHHKPIPQQQSYHCLSIRAETANDLDPIAGSLDHHGSHARCSAEQPEMADNFESEVHRSERPTAIDLNSESLNISIPALFSELTNLKNLDMPRTTVKYKMTAYIIVGDLSVQYWHQC